MVPARRAASGCTSTSKTICARSTSAAAGSAPPIPGCGVCDPEPMTSGAARRHMWREAWVDQLGEGQMGVIGTALSMSLDGFIAGQDGRARGLHDWLTDGETPSRFSPSFNMSAPSAEFFDEGVAGTGAVVAGRRT